MSNNVTKNYISYVPKTRQFLEIYEKDALKEIGKIVARDARAAVPTRTKTLQRNIGYRIIKKNKSVEIGVRKKAFYGKFVEEGHDIGNKQTGKLARKGRPSGGKSLGRVKEQPFLMPAMEKNMAKIKEIIKRTLGKLDNA